MSEVVQKRKCVWKTEQFTVLYGHSKQLTPKASAGMWQSADMDLLYTPERIYIIIFFFVW